MGNAENSDQEAVDANSKPPPAAVLETKNMGELGQTEAQHTEKEKMRRKEHSVTRLVEWLQFAVNAALAVVGAIAIFIYFGQLDVMKGQLVEIVKQYPEIQKQAKAATDAVNQAATDSVENSNRVERQLKILQQQAETAQVAADAARKQSITSEKQLEAADRPWISVDVSITSALTYDSSGAHVEFAFVPKNVGRSPAQNIYIDPRLTPATMGDDLSEIQRHICEADAKQNKNAMLMYILFPGEHYTQRIGMGISAADLYAYTHRTDFERSLGPDDIAAIALVGCVDYTYESSPRHHQTGFAFDVIMKDRRLVLKSLTPLAPESLILMPHPTGGHFAN
jgi:hypothetical protein